MKNKEIEELLNELQRRKQRYDYCKNNDISFSDEDYKSYLLLSYIEQLENKMDKAIECIEKQKKKMYKSRNKIALFILMKLENILKGDSDYE